MFAKTKKASPFRPCHGSEFPTAPRCALSVQHKQSAPLYGQWDCLAGPRQRPRRGHGAVGVTVAAECFPAASPPGRAGGCRPPAIWLHGDDCPQSLATPARAAGPRASHGIRLRDDEVTITGMMPAEPRHAAAPAAGPEHAGLTVTVGSGLARSPGHGPRWRQTGASWPGPGPAA
jgi:hypothetical protein